MPDKNDQWEDNIGGFSIVAGKEVSFYVDRECIICSVCSDSAPNNFRQLLSTQSRSQECYDA